MGDDKDYKDLLHAYMDRQYVNRTPLSEIDPENNEQFLPKTQMYLGVYVMEEMKKSLMYSRQDLMDYFHDTCQRFLVQACMEIKKRYDFSNPIMKKLKIFKAKNALSNFKREKTPSLLDILSMLPRLCSREQHQAVDDEWRALPGHSFEDVEQLKSMEIDQFWATLLTVKIEGGELLFYNLAKTVLGILSLPHSNSDNERIFSKINRFKTKFRNRLIVPTIHGIILSSQYVKSSGGCPGFRQSDEMISKMTKDSLYGYGPTKPHNICGNAVDSNVLVEDEVDCEKLFDQS